MSLVLREAGSPNTRLVLGANSAQGDALSVNLSETVQGVDALARAYLSSRGVNENTSVSDSMVRALLLGRSISESAPADDGVARLLFLGRGLDETLATEDSAARLYQAGREVEESTSVADALNRAASLSRLQGETLSTTDDLNRALAASRLLAEGVEGADSLARTLLFNRGLNETTQGADNLGRTVLLLRSLEEFAGAQAVVANYFGFVLEQSIENPSEAYFLLAEEAALKNLFQGLYVTDMNNLHRPVAVYFTSPDVEIRPQSYPYVLIDLIDVVEDRPRVQSQYGPPLYLPPGVPLADDTAGFFAPKGDIVPITPMLLTYQITSYSRIPLHDRQIQEQLDHGPLHPRYAQISVGHDNTLRRLVVLDFVSHDTMESGRKLFRNIWTVQIPAEIFYGPVSLTPLAESVTITTSELT